MKKNRGLIAVLSALTLLLSACAGTAATEAPPETEAPVTETPAAPEPSPEEEPEKTDAELAVFFSSPENMYLLDLSLPLMEEGYVDADTASFARAAALSFGRYARAVKGPDAPEELIGERAELVELKNGWLDAIGAAEDYAPFAPLRFERSTIIDADVYPFVIRSPYADWYFSTDDIRAQGYVGFMTDFLRFAPVAEQDFADAQEYLKGSIPDETPAVKICVGFGTGSINVSWHSAEFQYADGEHNRIQLYHDWDSAAYSLLHEYVHFLRREEKLTSAFCKEAITEGISTFACENRLRRLSSYDRQNKAVFRSLGLWDDENDCLDYRKYELYAAASYYLGYSGTYLSIAQYAVSHPAKMSWNYLSYEEGSCLAWYIIGLYGKDALLACATNDDLDQLIGKPMNEFYEEFAAWAVAQSVLNAAG